MVEIIRIYLLKKLNLEDFLQGFFRFWRKCPEAFFWPVNLKI